MYDIIGDVHGYGQLLKKLLLELGYKKGTEGYFHPERKAIFVGDFINRGPQIRKTIRIIRTMVENGNAYAILGNHEVNAIIAHIKDKKGNPLIGISPKNFIALQKTIKEFIGNTSELKEHIKWLRTLPFFLEIDGIRIVHACWSDRAVNYIKSYLPPGKIKKEFFREIYKDPKSELARSVWLLTKGIQFTLPGDLRLINNKGVSPRSYRLRWWEEPLGKTFEELSFESKYKLPSYTIPKQILPKTIPYPPDSPLIFFGHYCRNNGPYIIGRNICCIDGCVAGNKALLAYRWSGEDVLLAQNIFSSKK